MSDISPLPPPEPIYQAIESALAGHERGRRFLAEHARRSRHEETVALLEAVARLHERSAEASAVAVATSLDTDLPALRDLTATAEASLAEANGSPRSEDDDVFDMVEGIQETAWTMREVGTDASLCDLLDSLAGRLSRAYRGRGQRDLALARASDAMSRLGQHLAALEARLAGTSAEPLASSGGDALSREPDDSMMPDSDPSMVVSEPKPPEPSAPTRRKRKSRSQSAGPDRG